MPSAWGWGRMEEAGMGWPSTQPCSQLLLPPTSHRSHLGHHQDVGEDDGSIQGKSSERLRRGRGSVSEGLGTPSPWRTWTSTWGSGVPKGSTIHWGHPDWPDPRFLADPICAGRGGTQTCWGMLTCSVSSQQSLGLRQVAKKSCAARVSRNSARDQHARYGLCAGPPLPCSPRTPSACSPGR